SEQARTTIAYTASFAHQMRDKYILLKANLPVRESHYQNNRGRIMLTNMPAQTAAGNYLCCHQMRLC
ncbi:hypothetical protein, partial [Morganella psychrotolerans]|uniref:hypothetical protein n=1 Tax=Morganella psychrotolerans TaxID=368603 RepID=UPI001AA0378A